MRPPIELLLPSTALALAALLPAQPIRTVDIPGHAGQSYALFVPAAYTADRPWPVLYCLDPGARGRTAVERFAGAAEKAGFVVAGSNNSRNGPIAPSQEAVRLMVEHTHQTLSLDDTRIYAPASAEAHALRSPGPPTRTAASPASSPAAPVSARPVRPSKSPSASS